MPTSSQFHLEDVVQQVDYPYQRSTMQQREQTTQTGPFPRANNR
jgi:hypothetical protein